MAQPTGTETITTTVLQVVREPEHISLAPWHWTSTRGT